MNRAQLCIGLTVFGDDMVASAMRSLSQNSEFNFHNHAFHYEYSEVRASIAADFDVLPFRAEPDHLPKIIKLVKNNELQVMMLWSDEEAIASSKVRDNLIKAAGLKVPEYTVKSELSDFYHSLKFHGYLLSIKMIWNLDRLSILSCNVCMHWFMMLMWSD